MTQNPWCPLRITSVTPGATYESETFDQYISAVLPDGTAMELFDMAPMVGAGLAAGAGIAALVAVDPHTAFRGAGTDGSAVLGPPGQLPREDLPTVRAEVFDRPWALVAHHGGVLLLAPDRLQSAGGAASVTWRDARFVLMGWRPSGGRVT